MMDAIIQEGSNNNEILTIRQVAKYLNVTPATVYKLAKEGELPSFRVASEWRVRKNYLDQWIYLQSNPPKRVFVMDEDPEINKVLEKGFSEKGYGVISVGGREQKEVERRLTASRYD